MSKEDFPIALILTPILIVGGMISHEVIHVALNYAVTFELGSCGLGPLGIRNGRFYACYAERGIGAYNDLLTPLLTSIGGVVLIYISDRFQRAYLGWSTLVSGIYIGLVNALYGMALYNPPTITKGAVHYSGDGIDALTAFGEIIYIPYIIVLGVGFWICMGRVEFQTTDGI